jgi:hypothetical protein
MTGALLFVSGQKVRCGQSATTQLILSTGVILLLRGICDIGFRAVPVAKLDMFQ